MIQPTNDDEQMMTTRILYVLLAFAPTTISAQCSWTFRVVPLNWPEEVFTYEVDQIFNGKCYQAVQPVTVDWFSMLDITSTKSTWIVSVLDEGTLIDQFVISPGPLVHSCNTWSVKDTLGAFSKLTIRPSSFR